jgi:hypothetical protein
MGKVRYILLWDGGKKEHRVDGRFPGFALSSFWCGQCESEDVIMVRSSDFRQGPRYFDFLI